LTLFHLSPAEPSEISVPPPSPSKSCRHGGAVSAALHPRAGPGTAPLLFPAEAAGAARQAESSGEKLENCGSDCLISGTTKLTPHTTWDIAEKNFCS